MPHDTSGRARRSPVTPPSATGPPRPGGRHRRRRRGMLDRRRPRACASASRRRASARAAMPPAPQRAVEAPFAANSRVRAARSCSCAGAPVSSSRQCRFGRQLAAAKREPQSVARHRIDEAGGIARQQQSGTAGRCGIDGQRSERRDVRHLPRAARSAARSSGSSPAMRVRDHRRSARMRTAPDCSSVTDDADVGDSARQRRNADIAVGADVHLAARRQAVDSAEVGAERPASAATAQIATSPSANASLRMPAVGSDDDARRHVAFAAPPLADAHAVDAGVGRRPATGRATATPGSKSAPAATALRAAIRSSSRRVERHAARAGRVVRRHRRAARAGDGHARSSACARCTRPRRRGPAGRGSTSAPGIQRVAAQLVAGKRARSTSRTRTPARASTSAATLPAGPAPDDEHVTVDGRDWTCTAVVIRTPSPATSALFFDPKPRQLQSAASMSAGRAVLRDEVHVAAGIGSSRLIVGGSTPRAIAERRGRHTGRAAGALRMADHRLGRRARAPRRRGCRRRAARSATRSRRSTAWTCRGS